MTWLQKLAIDQAKVIDGVAPDAEIADQTQR
jgi:hypothetical protein